MFRYEFIVCIVVINFQMLKTQIFSQYFYKGVYDEFRKTKNVVSLEARFQNC